MTYLWDGLCAVYRVLGFDAVAKGDNVFRDLVLARIIEPTSKVEAGRVLNEVGVEAASYATLKVACRSMPNPGGGTRWPPRAHATPDWGRRRWSCST